MNAGAGNPRPDSQRPYYQPNDQHHLVPPKVYHPDPSDDPKERQRHGLGLHEIVDFDDGPVASGFMDELLSSGSLEMAHQGLTTTTNA